MAGSQYSTGKSMATVAAAYLAAGGGDGAPTVYVESIFDGTF